MTRLLEFFSSYQSTGGLNKNSPWICFRPVSWMSHKKTLFYHENFCIQFGQTSTSGFTTGDIPIAFWFVCIPSGHDFECAQP